MEKLIRTMLREALLSTIDKAETNARDYGGVFGTPICIDDDNGDMFYLFVGFNKYGKIHSFSYSFMLISKDNKALTDYMTKRSEVSKYIPENIKNKKEIFPIVENLTRKLLNSMIPQEIYRKTVEPLTGDSLERYNRITNIMINEYGYKLKETYVDNDGCTIWKLIKEVETENNVDMDESYEIGGIPSAKQILHDTFDWVLPLIPKREIKKSAK